MNTLLWFQRDLRLNNNPALNWAIQRGKPIIAIYVHSPEEDAPWAEGAASRWWLHHSLKKLSEDLLHHNIQLQFFNADSSVLIPRLAANFDVDAVVWTNRHEPQRIKLEKEIERHLAGSQITVKRIQDGLLTSPEQFMTASKNSPYKVFTPFYKRLRTELQSSGPLAENVPADFKACPPAHHDIGGLSLSRLALTDDQSWQNKLHAHWTPGETAAQEKLDSFLSNALEHYSTQRDIPASDGTSKLSPHLHFGEISVQQILNSLSPLISFHGGSLAAAAEVFLRQLIWREFARYTLLHFPDTTHTPMNSKFNASFWNCDKARLTKWQQGKTGIPIVDAGMRQLWDSGWMHNRVRMLVASLLTKNMGVAWQDGARWFWETLVDADLANNTMGWQWVAGCGVDAAPYFRIFNPYTQAKRFDPQQSYIQHWLKQTPEQPPIIDIAASRVAALDRYNRLIRGNKHD